MEKAVQKPKVKDSLPTLGPRFNLERICVMMPVDTGNFTVSKALRNASFQATFLFRRGNKGSARVNNGPRKPSQKKPVNGKGKGMPPPS